MEYSQAIEILLKHPALIAREKDKVYSDYSEALRLALVACEKQVPIVSIDYACPRCGAAVDGMTFCNNCGQAIKEVTNENI